MKIIRQRDIKDCGICSLESIIEYYGGKVSLEQLRIDAKVTQEGTSALNLILTAKKYGFDAVGIRAHNLEEINMLPAIAHLNLKNGGTHFVVIYKITKNNVILMDPQKGKVIRNKKDFYEEWSNVVLTFYPREKIIALKKDNKLLDVFIKILVYEKRIVCSIILFSILLTLFTILGGYYFQVLGGSINNNYDYKYLWVLVGFFFILVILRLVLNYIRGYLENHLNKNIDCILNENFLNHLFNLPLNVIASRTSGEIFTRFNELSNIKSLITNMFISSTLDVSLMLITMPFLININSKLFLILLLVIILYLLVGIISCNIIYKKAYQNIEYETIFNSALIEDIKMINSIKNLNVVKKRLKSLENKLTNFLYDSYLFNDCIHKIDTIKSIIYEIGFFVINAVGFYLIYENKIMLIELVTFNTLLNMFFDPLKNMIDGLPKYNFLKASFAKINDFLSVDVLNYGESVDIKDNSIRVCNLKYSYDSLVNVIDDFNVKIKSGELVLINGDSGSGKSTLCKIIDKYINDYEGNVYIGNNNIKDLSLATIRKNVLYVNQEEVLFSGTIKENILMDRECDINRFNLICNICEIDSIVNKKAMRYESFISDDLVNISGGEKQRIILARALINEFNILLLDEALSEVDIKLENKIINNIKKHFKDKTIIYVTHKNVQVNYDQRIVFGDNYELFGSN